MTLHNDYQSYMVRLYRQKKNSGIRLRIALENIQTGEQLAFDTVKALHDYLDGMAQCPHEDGEGADGEVPR